MAMGRFYTLSESPVLLTDDDSGFDCSLGQHGPVWFLAGLANEFEDFDKFVSLAGERTCSVPRGKALFFPIVNAAFVNEVGETTCADGPLEGPCTIEERELFIKILASPVSAAPSTFFR